MDLSTAILNLKSAIENAGGTAKFTIAVEDEKTFDIIKTRLQGVFNETNTIGEIEGFDGVKIWNQE